MGLEPNDVRLDAVTPDASVVPVSVPAAAVIVILEVPSNETPLIVRAVCSAVAVEALPVSVPEMPPLAMMAPTNVCVP